MAPKRTLNRTCSCCGNPISDENIYGICTIRGSCRSERERLRRKNDGDHVRFMMRRSLESNPARREQNRQRSQDWTKENQVRKSILNCKRRAEKLNVPFDSGIELILSLIPEKCPHCDREMFFGNGKQHSQSPSVDRNIPRLGYVPCNVSWMCVGCNASKRNWTMIEWQTSEYYKRGPRSNVERNNA